MALIEKLKAIADAIRDKAKITGLLTLDQMPEAIYSINTNDEESVMIINGASKAEFTDVINVSSVEYEEFNALRADDIDTIAVSSIEYNDIDALIIDDVESIKISSIEYDDINALKSDDQDAILVTSYQEEE